MGVPEEQQDGKRLGGRLPEAHRHLDGAPEVLLGDVEAMVVDLPVPQDVLMLGSLTEERKKDGGEEQRGWERGRSLQRFTGCGRGRSSTFTGSARERPGIALLVPHAYRFRSTTAPFSWILKTQNTDCISSLRRPCVVPHRAGVAFSPSRDGGPRRKGCG